MEWFKILELAQIIDYVAKQLFIMGESEEDIRIAMSVLDYAKKANKTIDYFLATDFAIQERKESPGRISRIETAQRILKMSIKNLKTAIKIKTAK
jgi:hypothetical protein